MPLIPALLPEKFRPVADRVVLQTIKASGVTAGGLDLPDVSKSQWETPRCLVLSVGPDCKQLKRGDLVLCFGDTQAYKIRHPDYYPDDESILVVQESRIAAVVGNVIDDPKLVEVKPNPKIKFIDEEDKPDHAE